MYDASPPTSSAIVIVGNTTGGSNSTLPGPKAFYQTRVDEISAEWAAFEDEHTGVEELRVGLGTFGLGTDVHEFGVLPANATSVSFSPPNDAAGFITGQAYYVVFRAMNPALAVNLVATAPLYIDTTPPIVSWVVDVFPIEVLGVESYFTANNSLGDVDTTGGSVVRAKFHCNDPESVAGGDHGTMAYTWRVCSNASATALCSNWTATGATPRAVSAPGAVEAVLAAPGVTRLVVHMRCTNPAGLWAEGFSDGMTIDETPADASTAVVADVDLSAPAPAHEMDWTASRILSAMWSGFTTGIGRPPIATYRFGVGSAPDVDDVVPFLPVGLATQAFMPADAQPLEQGVKYYAVVQAVTTAGSVTTLSSDGVTVDVYDPTPTVVHIQPLHLPVTNPARCASHLQCVPLPAVRGSTLRAVASATSLSFNITHINGTAPLTALRYGVGSCDPATLLDLSIAPLRSAASVRDREVFMDGLFMFHNARVCSVVFATSATGVVGYAAAEPVVVDLTPPFAQLVHEGSSSVVDDDAVASRHAMNVTVQCHDIESGIHHAEVSVSRINPATGAIAETTIPWFELPGTSAPIGTLVPVPSTLLLQNLSLADGARYVTTLRCINGAGAFEDLESDGFTVDSTVPNSTRARVQHAIHDLQVVIQADRSTLEASWSGFVDVESSVVGFAWSVGSSPGATDVIPVTDLGAVTTAVAAGLSLVDGTTYYVTVYATNGAELVSSATSAGVTVDGSAPVPSTSVMVNGTSADSTGNVEWVASTSELTAHWSRAIDAHTSVTYRWCIGTAAFGQQVLPWTNVGHRHTATATGLQLLVGTRYYVTVQATNAAGLAVFANSAAVAVDTVPPTPGTVAVAVHMLRAGAVAAPYTDWLPCVWNGFEEGVSHIAGYRVGFGTTPGAADVVPFTHVDAHVRQYNATGVSLVSGESYYCTVVGHDAAGNMAVTSSLGLAIDHSPPTVGRVLDIAPRAVFAGSSHAYGSDAVDVDHLPDEGRVAAAWPGWSDSESRIARVIWAIGTAPGEQDVQPWRHVAPHRTSAVAELKSLVARAASAAGRKLFVTVRVYNHAGLWSEASSNGVVLLRGPNTESPVDGTALDVSASILYIPTTPNASSNAVALDWCGCGNPDGSAARSGAVFDPMSHTCSCGPGTFLHATTGQCAPCPAGTCKSQLGNAASLCMPSACASLPAVPAIPRPPVPVSLLTPCSGKAGSQGRVVSPVDGTSCVCPAGTRTASTGECIPCEAGTVNPIIGDVEACRVCWEPVVPDLVLHVTWNASAAAATTNGDADAIVVSVGTSPGALRWTRVFAGNTTHAQLLSRQGDIPYLRDGSTVYVRVRVQVAGHVVSDARASATVQLKPPTAGVVFDGPTINDDSVLADGANLHASWSQFRSSGGQLTYSVAFGSGGPFTTDVAPWQPVPPGDTSATLRAEPPVSDGTVVYASVRAVTPSGEWVQAASDGAAVQSQLPPGGLAIVSVDDALAGGTGTSITHTLALSNADAIAATWLFAEPGSGPVVSLTYTWTVVDLDDSSAPNGKPLFQPQDVGSATWGVAATSARAALISANGVPVGITSIALLNAPLLPNHRYVVRVTAKNQANVSSVIQSAPTMVETTSPVLGNVTSLRGDTPSFPEYATTDVVFQASQASLGVRWECSDAETLVTEVRAVVASVAGGVQGSPAAGKLAVFNSTDAWGQAIVAGLALRHGHCYRASIACVNNAQLASDYQASGNAVCVDTTPPQVAVSLRRPVLNFAATDAFATTPSVAAVTAFVLASSPSSIAAASSAIDEDHLHVAATHLVLSEPRADTVFVSSLLGLHVPAEVTITVGDAESTVRHAHLEWLSTSPPISGDVNLTALSLLGSGHVTGGISWGHVAAASTSDELIRASVQAVNGAGEAATAVSSAGVVFDGTEPQPCDPGHGDMGPVVRTRYQSLATRVEAQWCYSDPTSGVVGVTWSLVHPSGATVVAPTWAGTNTDLERDGLQLHHNHTYQLRVTACNGAFMCRTDSMDLIVDQTPPVHGVVYLGSPDSAVEAGVCSGGNGLPPCAQPTVLQAVSGDSTLELQGRLSWSEFWDDESGVASYRVALGTAPSGSQLGPPVTLLANATRSVPLQDLTPDLSSLSLFNGQMLYASVTATNGAGVSTTVSAALLVVDTWPALPGAVAFNGSIAALPTHASAFTPAASVPSPATTTVVSGGSVVVQARDDEATVSWTPFTVAGALSSVNQYDVVLKAEDSGIVVAGPLVVSGSNSTGLQTATFSGLSLAAGRRYVADVTATDVVGNTMTARVERPLVVDLTPPHRGGNGTGTPADALRDGWGAGIDEDCHPRAGVTATLSAGVYTLLVDQNQTGWAVAASIAIDSSEAAYEQACGTGIGQDQGLVTATVDASGAQVLCGGIASQPTNRGTVLRFGVDPFVDLESGVVSAELVVGTGETLDDVMKWTAVPLNATRFQVVVPTLAEGSFVVAGFRWTNAAGLAATVVSDGVRLLCEAGSPGCDFDGTFVCLT